MLNYRANHADRLRDHAPGMGAVADYTEPSLMLPLLRRRDAAAATAELCSLLQRLGRISDLLPFYHAVLSHESLSSTAISPGWAMPHARLAGISQLSFALGRTAEPLAWFGGEPVSLVFLFAVPECDGGAYLNLIASLARLSQDRLRLARLADAPDSRSMFEVLQEIPLPKRPAAVVNP
ncbi:MAG: PTS sugar transporter subunit IIA [Verrucomicrobia bacterium]|nr:PTS sugar transporter subunit IIA [Verrucomicrobiota bacterium]